MQLRNIGVIQKKLLLQVQMLLKKTNSAVKQYFRDIILMEMVILSLTEKILPS